MKKQIILITQKSKKNKQIGDKFAN